MTLIPIIFATGCALKGGDTSRPFVTATSPVSGAQDVSAGTTYIEVEFNEPMRPQSWSWVRESVETYPETSGDPTYISATRIRLPVVLKGDHDYVVKINSEPKYLNFRDASGNPAVPFVLTFRTAPEQP